MVVEIAHTGGKRVSTSHSATFLVGSVNCWTPALGRSLSNVFELKMSAKQEGE